MIIRVYLYTAIPCSDLPVFLTSCELLLVGEGQEVVQAERAKRGQRWTVGAMDVCKLLVAQECCMERQEEGEQRAHRKLA